MPKILLVTDSEWVRNDVKAALGVGGWELSELDDPKAAADTAAQVKADTVAVDMQVGSMGGMAVIRSIRGVMEGSQRPRLVLLLDRSADQFLARRAGADASVLKPFTAQGFRAALSG